jgi:HlyD family secretion protein
MIQNEKIDFTPIEIPKVRRGYWGLVKIVAALVAIGCAGWAWSAGYRPPLLGQERPAAYEIVEIDRGDINLVVMETGTVESSNNRTVRCTVEALLGQVGGSQGMGASKGAAGTGSQGGQGSSGAGAGGAQSAAPAATAKAKTAKKAVSSTSSAGAATSTGTTTGTSGSTTSATTTSGSSTASGSTSSGTAASSTTTSTTTTTTTTSAKKPAIRSFSYAVAKYLPLRPATVKAVDTSAQKKQQQMQPPGGGGGGGRGGRGGGGGGRGGRGGGGMMEEEKPGATTIVEIIPEGSRVKTGDVICRLDSSAFVDEERAQLIRHVQAKSYVEQANAILAVNEITLKEYRDGIYPQDVSFVKQYIETCKSEKDRLESAAGFRTKYQVKGDELALEQAKIALGEAENMLARLIKQTGPKIITSLKANIEAIKADKYMQDAAFSLESQRLERIQKNIKNCTLVAPSDGIVVYVNDANRWGQVTAPIDQGVTVRQDQPIINLPDPLHMRVKARINESKLSLIHTGQKARIVIDAYPEKILQGRVAEITPINVPLNASDVRVYYANVDIEKGFDELRPGLSAEVNFMVDHRRDVTRIPLESVRWSGEQSFAAVQDPSAEAGSQGSWIWRPIQIGMTDTLYAEVVSGLKPGDRVIAFPRKLPAPAREAVSPEPTKVADLAR